MKRKKLKTTEEIKEEILKMSAIDIKLNTKYIIEFEDYGQDFLEWYIDERGFVLDSKPFQSFLWVGKFTIPQFVKVGELLPIWIEKGSYIKYPIKSIQIIGEKTNEVL